jgi:hypothetical protein
MDRASRAVLMRTAADERGARRARSREVPIAKVLKRSRICCCDAAHVLDVLGRQPVQVAAGTIEAASAHLATLICAHASRQPSA